MPNGIIYIARNNSLPLNHYKIGKSDRADPTQRMRELTSDTTNYQGEFFAKGYVLVSEVDECERLVHDTLNHVRINERREFFEIDLAKAINIIRKILKDNIIQDFFEDIDQNEKKSVKLLTGDREDYPSNHLLNFIDPKEIQSLSFKEIVKFAEVHGWSWNLSCHGGNCLYHLRHAFYVLLNKENFINKFSEDPLYVPILDQTMYSRENIPFNKAILFQKLILQINLREYLNDIKFPNNLGYLGVAMHMIGEKIEIKNKKLTKFLIPEFIKLYPRPSDIVRELDQIYYNGEVLDCGKLEIFERLMDSNNVTRSQDNRFGRI